jgi:hypothetical protein
MPTPHRTADRGLAAVISAPASTDPATWHRYIRSAPSFAQAQSRIEEAASSGVEFIALLSVEHEGASR